MRRLLHVPPTLAGGVDDVQAEKLRPAAAALPL